MKKLTQKNQRASIVISGFSGEHCILPSQRLAVALGCNHCTVGPRLGGDALSPHIGLYFPTDTSQQLGSFVNLNINLL